VDDNYPFYVPTFLHGGNTINGTQIIFLYRQNPAHIDKLTLLARHAGRASGHHIDRATNDVRIMCDTYVHDCEVKTWQNDPITLPTMTFPKLIMNVVGMTDKKKRLNLLQYLYCHSRMMNLSIHPFWLRMLCLVIATTASSSLSLKYA